MKIFSLRYRVAAFDGSLAFPYGGVGFLVVSEDACGALLWGTDQVSVETGMGFSGIGELRKGLPKKGVANPFSKISSIAKSQDLRYGGVCQMQYMSKTPSPA